MTRDGHFMRCHPTFTISVWMRPSGMDLTGKTPCYLIELADVDLLNNQYLVPTLVGRSIASPELAESSCDELFQTNLYHL